MSESERNKRPENPKAKSILDNPKAHSILDKDKNKEQKPKTDDEYTWAAACNIFD